MMTVLAISQLTLERYPKTSDQSLRAWNAADEYLVDHIKENVTLDNLSKVLIINDQFGALTCSFSQFSPICWSDSFLSRTAVSQNLKTNNSPEEIHFIERIENIAQSDTQPDIHFDLVIIRIPKHNSLLAFQLKSIAQFVNHNTIIIAAGMTKEIHNSTSTLFEKFIGKTTTSLAKKKARLIFSKPSIAPKTFKDEPSVIKTYEIQNHKVTSYGLPGVFSRDSLDIGSRVLLKYLPETKENQKLIDLGCGTGILGTIVAKENLTLKLTFCDESFLAVESAKITYEKNIGKIAKFNVTDVLAGLDNNHYDHILCNPPFHQQNVQTLSIANKMFRQSAQKLRANGELRVVANRHLKYRPMLNQYFNNVKIISDDSKFIVWLATNPQL